MLLKNDIIKIMNKRKFNSSRFYKLLKTIVIVVTVLSLLNAFQLYINTNSSIQRLKTNRDECLASSKGLDTGFSVCSQVYLTELTDYANLQEYSLLLGIFLPIGFFGLTTLYKYLFPKST